jgi:hypothetical protein
LDPNNSNNLDNPDVSGDSDSEMTSYDPQMPWKLADYGVFDEMFDGDELKKPRNLQAILKHITSMQNDGRNKSREMEKGEYKRWAEAILAPAFSEDTAGLWFHPYMDIDILPLPPPHLKETNTQWKTMPDSQIRTWKPKPDFVEGIIGQNLPRWVSNALGAYVIPDSDAAMALPNLVAEFKGKGYMKIAHQQARLDGGYATQGFFKLYKHLDKLNGEGKGKLGDLYKGLDFTGNFLDQALVGSLEFNGEVIIGNVHWAAKSTDVDREVDYHMRRVMCHLTRGIGFDDFIKNQAEARNFRQYFTNVREKIFKELLEIPQPGKPLETYKDVAGAHLKAMCKSRGIPVGKVGEMRQALQENDKRSAIVARQATPGPSDTLVSVDNIFTPSVRSPNVTNPKVPGSSFKRLRVSTEEDSEDQASPSPKRVK